MSSKIFLTLLFVSVLIFSCQEKVDIDDQYLTDIAKSNTVESESNSNVVIVNTNNQVPTLKSPDSTPVPKAPVKKPAPAKKVATKKPVAKKVAAKPKTFYSPYIEDTITTDHPVIKAVRLMIANKEYDKAANYIAKYIDNPEPGLDVGHLYHFKGLVYYFLSAKDKANVIIASDSFAKVANNTDKEKFKRLAVLWNGMLYETYGSTPEDLNKAIAYFDVLLNMKGRDIYAERFLADAAYYKACALRKLGKTDEANEEIRRIKTGVYQDKDIYSHKALDYVPFEKVLAEDSAVVAVIK